MTKTTRMTFTNAVRKAQKDDGTMTFLASSESLSTDGMIIRASAWSAPVEQARKSGVFPPVLIGHQMKLGTQDVPAIAKIVDARVLPDEGLEVDIRFADEDVNPNGPRFRRAYEEGFLTDVSVSWMGAKLEVDRKTGEMLKPPTIVDIGKWVELSLVPVGADPAAKKRAMEEFGCAELVADEDAGTRDVSDDDTTDDDDTAATQITSEHVRIQGQDGHEYTVAINADGKLEVSATLEGDDARTVVENHADCPSDKPVALVSTDSDKVLGCHKTKADAAKQEAAIEKPRAADPAQPVTVNVDLSGLEEIRELLRELKLLVPGLIRALSKHGVAPDDLKPSDVRSDDTNDTHDSDTSADEDADEARLATLMGEFSLEDIGAKLQSAATQNDAE